MQKLLFVLIMIATANVAQAKDFVMTPMPPVYHPAALARAGGCAANDCTETRISLPAALPSPALDSLAPSAGSDADFCRDVNVGTHKELCANEQKLK